MLTYYSAAIVTTVLLFGIVIRGVTATVAFPIQDYILESLLRFAAQSDLVSVLPGATISSWILASMASG